MKRLLFTMACAALVMSAFAECIAYWDFSSDAKGEIELMGNYGLDNSGGVTIADGAAVFDGSVRCLSTKREVGFSGVGAYTIECFAKADKDCNGMIMELSPNINNSQGSFYIYANEGAMVRGSSATAQFNGEQFNNGNICDGQWHHIALIVNPAGATAADKVQLYLDGVRQTKHVQNKMDSCLYTHRLYIGSRGGKSMPFKGMIDDVRITEGVLSADKFMQTRSEKHGLDVRAFWKFDDGNALADASGNGNTLQGSQGVTFANGFASFNGTASDVRTAETLDLSDAKDVTVEFFVRKHDGKDNMGMVLEHSKSYYEYEQGFYAALNDQSYSPQGKTTAGNINCEFRFTDGKKHRAGVSPEYAVNSGWHHVAIVKDSSRAGKDDCVSLYVDGVRQTIYQGTATDSSALLRNDYLYIGSRNNESFLLDADVDDVRITAEVLLPGQFLQTRTGTMEDVIAYWSFENADTMFVDESGNGNMLTGSGVIVNDNGAAEFDGSQSGFATLAPLPLYAYDSMTVEWFMKSDMSGEAVVLESSANYNNFLGSFCVVTDGNAGTMSAGYKTKNGFNVPLARNVMDGRWHHFALVYDWDETNYLIVKLYRDGVLMTEFANNFASPAGVNLRSDRLFIGSRGGSSLKFVGELDDIKLTGRALSPSEFMKKRSKPPKGLVINFK